MSERYIETRRRLYRRSIRLLPFGLRHLLDYLRVYRRAPHPTGSTHSERMLLRARGNKSPLFTAMCSKDQMKIIARDAGAEDIVSIPQTAWSGPAEELTAAVADLPPGEWVLKPNNLGGGLAYFLQKRDEIPTIPAPFFADVEEQALAFRALAPRAWRGSKPGYIIERKIGEPGVILRDFKVHLFAGRPRILSVYSDRAATLSVTHYLLPDATDILFQRGPIPPVDSGLSICELANLSAIAQQLALNMDYIRIDFYIVRGRIWFGEYSPFGGLEGLAQRPDVDRMLGEWWDVSGGSSHE